MAAKLNTATIFSVSINKVGTISPTYSNDMGRTWKCWESHGTWVSRRSITSAKSFITKKGYNLFVEEADISIRDARIEEKASPARRQPRARVEKVDPRIEELALLRQERKEKFRGLTGSELNIINSRINNLFNSLYNDGMAVE